MKQLKCSNCKKYHTEPDMIRRGVVSFCSIECMNEKRYAVPTPKPKEKKKRIKKKSRSGVSSATREYVLKGDAYACRFCGMRKEVEVHHINYRSEQGSHEPCNLITLCKEHHDVVHSNKKRWKPLCLGIVWLREVKNDAFTTIPMLEKQQQQKETE